MPSFFHNWHFIFAIGLLLSACGTHKSPLQEPEGQQPIYAIEDENAAFRAVFDALTEAAPNTPIIELDGPVRGYYVVRQPVISKYTTMVRLYPGTGRTATGNIVNGYYAEVSGTGELFDGPSFDEKVYKLVTHHLMAAGTKFEVTKLKRSEYKLDRDRWRLTDKPSLRDGGSLTIQTAPTTHSKSVTERLEELDTLKVQKMISEQEYKTLRQNILSDL